MDRNVWLEIAVTNELSSFQLLAANNSSCSFMGYMPLQQPEFHLARHVTTQHFRRVEPVELVLFDKPKRKWNLGLRQHHAETEDIQP